jgi:hypothetical protein
MSEERSRWRWPRWLFILAIVTAVTIITIRTIDFLGEAQMSLGLNRTPGAGIAGQLVNQQRFDPPSDSLLRIGQAHIVLRVAEAIDSLSEQKARTPVVESAVAAIMNQHMMSRSAYWWVRSQVIRTLERTPQDHRDSANVRLLRMLRPRFLAVRRVYRDTLDGLLRP